MADDTPVGAEGNEPAKSVTPDRPFRVTSGATALSLREDEIQQQTAAYLLKVKARYADPRRAFWLIAAAFAIVLVSYVLFVALMRPQKIEPEALAKPSQSFFLNLDYDDAALERSFSRADINDAKRLIEADLERVRNAVFRERTLIMQSAAAALCEEFGGAQALRPQPPYVVEKFARQIPFNQPLYGGAYLQEGRCGDSWASGVANAAPTQADIQQPSVVRVTAEYLNRLDDGRSQKRFNATVEELNRQAGREAAILRDAAAELATLEAALSFHFLAAGGDFGWVFHLTVWAWFGVIASTLVGTSSSVLQGRYDGLLFAFVWMKFILAPLISVVVAAIFNAGVTEGDINLAHQPMFLMYAFFAGFFSERLTEIIRQAANTFFAAAKVDKASFERVTGRVDRFRSVPKLVTNQVPDSLTSLRSSLEAIGANAVLELVETRAKKNTDQGKP